MAPPPLVLSTMAVSCLIRGHTLRCVRKSVAPHLRAFTEPSKTKFCEPARLRDEEVKGG